MANYSGKNKFSNISNVSTFFKSQNRKLVEPLKKAQEENEELSRQMANYEKDKRSLKRAKNRLQIQEKEMKDLKWEHEVLEQQFNRLKEVILRLPKLVFYKKKTGT